MMMHWVQWGLRMSLELFLLFGWTLQRVVSFDANWRNYVCEERVQARDWKDAELQT